MAAIDSFVELLRVVWTLEIYADDDEYSDRDIRQMVKNVARQVRTRSEEWRVVPPEPKTLPMFDGVEQREDDPEWMQIAEDEMAREMELDGNAQ